MPPKRPPALAALVALAACDRGAPSAPSASATALPAEAPAAPPPSPGAPLGGEGRVGGEGRATEASLAYEEIVTGGAEATDELPMLVAIHGLGDSPKNFSSLFTGLPIKARCIFPRGPLPFRDGFSWFPIRVGAGGPALDEGGEAMARSADAVARLAERIANEKRTRGKPVVMGFSQGGLLSFAVAARHPEKITAAFPVAGWLPPSLRPGRAPAPAARPPVVALHGAADSLVPLALARDAVAALDEAGFDAELKSHEGVGHAVSPAMRAELVALVGAALSAAR